MNATFKLNTVNNSSVAKMFGKLATTVTHKIVETLPNNMDMCRPGV